jgi:hypothetical protein
LLRIITSNSLFPCPVPLPVLLVVPLPVLLVVPLPVLLVVPLPVLLVVPLPVLLVVPLPVLQGTRCSLAGITRNSLFPCLAGSGRLSR